MPSKRRPVLGAIVVALCLVPSSARAEVPRLDYRAVEALKDAKYYLGQVEGNMKAYDEKSAGWKVGDSTVPLRELDGMLSTRRQVDQYLANVEARFKALPPEHPEVKKEKQHAEQVKAKVEATFNRLGELKAGLAGVVKQGESPEFKRDSERLTEINRLYADTGLLVREAERDVETIRQLDAVRAERKRFGETYAALLNQQTPEAQGLRNQLNYFDEVMTAFDKRSAEWRAQTPATIDAMLKKAGDSARQAAAEKRPLWFSPTSDIAGNLRRAQARLDLWAAFGTDAPAVTAAQAKVDAARQEVATAAGTLEADILAANRVPEEGFAGPDKAELIALMKAAWAAEAVKGDVLATGMNSEGWRRDTRWEWNGGAWRKVDRSRTQGFVVRKIDDATAAAYYVNFTKDHLDGDRIGVSFLDDLKAEPAIERRILVKHIK